jgi:hypothetical protein
MNEDINAVVKLSQVINYIAEKKATFNMASDIQRISRHNTDELKGYDEKEMQGNAEKIKGILKGFVPAANSTPIHKTSSSGISFFKSSTVSPIVNTSLSSSSFGEHRKSRDQSINEYFNSIR